MASSLKGKKKYSVSVQRWPVSSSSRLHILQESKPVFHLTVQSPPSCEGERGVRGSPLSQLSSQARDESLPWKQKAQQGGGEAHPHGEVLSLVPHELQGDKETRGERKPEARRRFLLRFNSWSLLNRCMPPSCFPVQLRSSRCSRLHKPSSCAHFRKVSISPAVSVCHRLFAAAPAGWAER